MEITSRKNETVRYTRALAREKKIRTENSEFLIEGDKLCREAVKERLKIRCALAAQSAFRRYPETVSMLAEISDIITISEDLSEYISDTKTPQGIFIIAKFLDKFSFSDTIEYKRSFLALDGLQDAGNTGTVIRTCDAFSIGGLMLSEACADIYSPKVVRAAMGSLFRLPVFTGDLGRMLGECGNSGFEIFGAMLDREAEPLGRNTFSKANKAVAVIGNEGNGISEKISGICGHRLFIPISSAESLNAASAASVIAWEMSRQLQG